jgi:hypothetical protein
MISKDPYDRLVNKLILIAMACTFFGSLVSLLIAHYIFGWGPQ